MRRASLWLRGSRAPVLALAAIPFLFYGRFILGDELSNADVFLAYRPAHAWLAEGLRRGQVPMWNPYLLGGFPLAFSEYGWFSPLTWAGLLALGPHAGYYALVALYVGAAGVAAYALAQALGASTAGAALAGAVYGFSPYVVGGAPLLNQGAAYWALPGLLWCVERAFAGRHWAAPAAAGAIALSLLGSHPQLSLLVLLPPAAYALALGGRRRDPWTVAALAAAGLLGAAASAVRFLPTLSLVAASERAGGLGLAASALGSVSPLNLLVGLVLPSLAIPRVTNPQWTAYVGALSLALAGSGIRTCRPRAAGVFLACLGAAGLVLALGSYTPLYWLLLKTPLFGYFREPSRFLLWTVLAVAILAARGLDANAETPPARRRSLPLALVVALVGLFVAAAVALRLLAPRIVPLGHLRALAGIPAARDYTTDHYIYVFDAAWRQLLRVTNPLAPGLLLPLLALAGAAWWWRDGRGRRWAKPVALAVTALPLLIYDQLRLPVIPAAVVAETRPALGASADSAVLDERGMGDDPALRPRVLSWLPLAVDFEVRLRNDATGGNADVASYRLLRDLLAPNFGTPLHVPQVDGYENIMTHEQALLAAALGSERAPRVGAAALVAPVGLRERQQRIGERWNPLIAAGGGALLSDDSRLPVTWPATVRYTPGSVRASRSGAAIATFSVAHPLPRAFVTPEWTAVASADDALRALIASNSTSPGVPPIVVVDPAGQAASRPAASGAGREGIFDARVTAYKERHIEIATEADADALLVLLDAMAPGWTATVTGAPVPILTANVAFRAVRVPAGRHEVVFNYVPPLWSPAIAISGVAAVLLVAWLAITAGPPVVRALTTGAAARR